MAIKITCPNSKCKKSLKLDPKLAGRKIACSGCKMHIRLPTAEQLGLSPKPEKPGEEKHVEVTAADLEKMMAEMASEDQTASQQAEAEVKIKFNCPQCDDPIEAELKLSGKQMPCPSCRRIVKVPKADVEAKKDWREKQAQGPSLAKKEEVKLEGEWGTQSVARVSTEALAGAKALPIQRVKLTPWQWAKRIIALLLLIGIGIFSYWMFDRYRWSSLENNALSDLAALAQPGKIQDELLPWASLRVAEYKHRYGDEAAQKEASSLYRTSLRLAGLRDQLSAWDLARHAMPLQLDAVFFATDPAKAIQTVEDLHGTMNLCSFAEPRWIVLRDAVRPILARIKNQPEQVAKLTTIINNITNVIPGVQVATGSNKPEDRNKKVEDISERLACLSAYGVELYLADLKPDSVKVAQLVRSQWKDEFAMPRIVAMHQQLAAQPEFELPKTKEQGIREGRILAFTLQKQDAQAMTLFNQNKEAAGFSEEHLMLLLELVDLYLTMPDRKTDISGRLSEAFDIASKNIASREVNWNARLWAHYRICELTLQAGDKAQALQRADQLQLPSQAKVLLERDASISGGKLELPADPIASSLAAFELGRKLTPSQGTTVRSWANDIPSPAKYFARLGVAEARK